MKLDDEEEVKKVLGFPYVQSPWDGELRADFDTWGYSVREEPYSCDFDTFGFERALEALGVNPYGAQPIEDDPDHDSDKEKKRDEEAKGRNYCYRVEHNDGSTVKKDKDGKPDPPGKSNQKYMVGEKEYRTTGAYNEVGLNTIDGIVYFLDCLSPIAAAESYWDMDEVPKDALPGIRSTSDLTWGLWNRVANIPPLEQGLNNQLHQTKYFMVKSAVNVVTQHYIIPRVLKMQGLKENEVKKWPGSEFRADADGEEGDAVAALIGSPNGLAAAYFLIQHKKQLGGSKFIWKVRIFKSDEPDMPANDYNLLFFVDSTEDPADPPKSPTPKDPPPKKGGKGPEGNFESKLAHRSRDGKSVLREHVFRARL